MDDEPQCDKRSYPRHPGSLMRIGLAALAWVMGLAGSVLAIGGAVLVLAGGTAYYVLAGAGVLVAAVLLLRDRPLGVAVYSVVVLLSIPWALWEVGLDAWALMPRLLAPGVLLAALAAFLPALLSRTPVRRLTSRAAGPLAGAAGVCLVAVAVAAVIACRFTPAVSAGAPSLSGSVNTLSWAGFGGGQGGQRFSTATQITPQNVGRLTAAWVYHTRDLLPNGMVGAFEATPVEADGWLYFCTPHDIVVALDARTGAQRWRYDPHVPGADRGFSICRGVTYYEGGGASPGSGCVHRVAVGTLDFRLIVLDAHSGRPCRDFGVNGAVDLRSGFPPFAPGQVLVTSPPTYVSGLLILSQFIMDGQRTDSPPGVVRAFDGGTGALRWAWDPGRPDVHEAPPAGETYALGTPNSWTKFSADPALGLVYVPTGGMGVDYFGGERSAAIERYQSSIVALDVATGAVRWVFRAIRHDIWDYDLAAQPVLFDFPASSGPVPALAEATKTGALFVLDRRNGRPLVAVSDRPVPTDAVRGEHPSPVQPSSAMPDLGGARLTESRMWGLTPVDQMICRIEFRRSRYEGPFTPPGLQPTIEFPGFAGGINWGGIAIDPLRGIIIAPSTQLANRVQLVRRTPAQQAMVLAEDDPGMQHAQISPYPQKGTWYAAFSTVWLSELEVPCQQPPWGLLSAISIRTRRLLWQRRLGDATDSGPFGIALHLPLPIGTPNMGGALLTASGLTFVSGTLDQTLRAFDTATGQLLWQVHLPAGAQAGPATYVESGRQYVVIAAGGHQEIRSRTGDEVIAFRLPAEPED